MILKSVFTGFAVVLLSLQAGAQARLVRELGNSSASDMSYMAPFWDKFAAMHLNTILSPVYWELMEPVEGRFDFGLVDSMVSGACRIDAVSGGEEGLARTGIEGAVGGGGFCGVGQLGGCFWERLEYG